MIIDSKQINAGSGGGGFSHEQYEEFMRTRFPELTHFSINYNAGYAAKKDEKGRYVINMDKGIALTVSKLPKTISATYKNKAAGSLNIFWDDAARSYNPNKSGEQILRAGIEMGVYNPLNLAPEVVMMIARSEKLSLQNWWSNGAKVANKSYADGIKANDFAILSDYFITNISAAFKGASTIESLPELSTETETTLTSMANAFEGCAKLKMIPSIPTSGVTSFVKAFHGCESISDLSHINMSKANNIEGAFSGCVNLAKLPDMSNLASAAPISYVDSFRGCASLPAVFPYVLNMSSVSKRENVSGVFEGSSVKEVTIKYTGETIPEYFCPLFMGNSLEKIIIVDSNNEIREVRTKENNPKMISYLAAGVNKLTIPAGINSMKVALVSGVSYRFDDSGSVSEIGATNNPSTIMRGEEEVASSRKDAAKRGHYFDWIGTQEQHGGNPAEFDAQYEDYSKQVYCCGVGGGKQYTKYTHAWAALENTFVQDVVKVTPGEELTINVGKGGTTGSSCVWNKKPSNGVYNGYVLIEFQ